MRFQAARAFCGKRLRDFGAEILQAGNGGGLLQEADGFGFAAGGV